MKIEIIVNPVSGAGYAEELWRSAKEKFSSLDYTVHLTEHVGHATELAREAVGNEAEYIVCFGGDGTINEIVQSIIGTNVTLVPVSAGTGSDFVKTVGAEDVDQLISRMKRGESTSVDAASVEFEDRMRYFINVLEIGFGASVMERVNSHKKIRGSRSFTSAVFRELLSLKNYSFDISYADSSQSIRAMEIVVANGRYFGGGMLASGVSSVTDGKLDVHIINSLGKIKLLSKLSKLRSGEYINDKIVTNLSLERMKITGDNAPIEVDGECIGKTPAEIKVIPESVRVLSIL